MAASDLYPGLQTPTAAFAHAEAVTPSDTVDLTYVSGMLYVGSVGDVTVITKNGETVLFKAVPTGTFVPIRASRVKTTGTTASQITALA